VPKHRALIQAAEPCDTNLHADGPKTLEEAKERGRELCPYFSECTNDGLRAKSRACLLQYGVQVARNAIWEGHSVDREMSDFRREATQFLRAASGGMIWSDDRKRFEIVTDLEKGIALVRQFAISLTGDSGGSTSRSFERLVASCVDKKSGAIDLAALDALEGSCGRNGGRGCDVTSGPCSCGAWH
jgi:hypothetical protein